jgi:hypothetical protein
MLPNTVNESLSVMIDDRFVSDAFCTRIRQARAPAVNADPVTAVSRP